MTTVGSILLHSCPLPPKPGFGVQVWEGLSGECRTGLTLERSVSTTQLVNLDVAAVWLVEDGVHQVCLDRKSPR